MARVGSYRCPAAELRSLAEQLAGQRGKAELALRKEGVVLETRIREIDLEMADKPDLEKARLEASIRTTAAVEQSLKLKEDQRTPGAALAVLVWVVLPDDLRGFGCLDDVWVSDLQSWPARAVALREQLTRVAFAHAASRGKNEKMELLYRYLAGDQFRQRVLGIVEAFTGMQAQLARERRAMEKLWRECEKQIERVTTNNVGMYGEMRGLIGASMQQIRALELDGEELEELSADEDG